jgi:glycosyltransferase involved in cell wall biosynthesis
MGPSTSTNDVIAEFLPPDEGRGPTKPSLLAFCYEFPPNTTPTANRSAELLTRLSRDWQITVITPEGRSRFPGLRTLEVPVHPTGRARRLLERARLKKLIDWIPLPDELSSWADGALETALNLCANESRRPDLLLSFMYPYASGEVCLKAQARTGIPAVFNFDDSPSCDDMHPSYPSRFHFARALAWEDRIVRAASAVIYVSERNLEKVRQRQAPHEHQKLHLIRYGVSESAVGLTDAGGKCPTARNAGGPWEILYSGNMNGWVEFFDPPESTPRLKKLFAAWNRWGQHTCTRHDLKGSSPYYLIQAMRRLEEDRKANPRRRFHFRLIGNLYPQTIIERALVHGQMAGRVTVEGPVNYQESLTQLARADVLFMCLPGRLDGTPGGRISAKTYEYLATDRPILAALPPGENREYLQGQPGVWLVKPDDTEAIAQALNEIAGGLEKPRGLQFNRAALLPDLGYDALAKTMDQILRGVLASRVPRPG